MINKPRRLPIATVFLLFAGCAQQQQMVFDKSGATQQELKRDNYECIQQSRTQWSGGGTGLFGIGMMIATQNDAQNQAQQLFVMCMEARGYTGKKVSADEFNGRKADYEKSATLLAESESKCGKSEYRVVFVKSACKTADITSQQRLDTSVITEEEKNAFLKYRDEQAAISNKALEIMQESSDPRLQDFRKFFVASQEEADANAFDLVSGMITWGQYNRRRIEASQALSAEKARLKGTR